jgi:branched-chain amino acid transport system permease protein
MMQHITLQVLNSLAFGGLLFLLASGFSLIFGLMRIPNLAHGAMFMLGAYVALGVVRQSGNFWIAIVAAGLIVCAVGVAIERWILRPLASNENAQVLATLGIAFLIADIVLSIWGGDPQQVRAPGMLRTSANVAGIVFPLYRLAVIALAIGAGIALWLFVEKTRIGAMLRASVDDPVMARGVGIPVSLLFTFSFGLGALLAGLGGALAAPVLSAYPGLDHDMLPLALVVVVLGGVGSLMGALFGSVLIGFLYVIGQEQIPSLSYVIVFIPMVIVLALRPKGLFGRVAV